MLDEEKQESQRADSVAGEPRREPYRNFLRATLYGDGTLDNGEHDHGFRTAVEAVRIVAAAAIIQGGVVDGRYPSQRDPADIDFCELVPVAPLSFQAAGQIIDSGGLGMNEVLTAVIASLLCDLVSDENLMASLNKNAKRNRRAIAFMLTLVGAICGGWLSKATGAVQPRLWLVAGIKGTITLFWVTGQF
ncbi:hypothetical protein DL770_008688 [Monosporascus sp. CRB-9-2]|nr:hypothetical protein DL770_008688 [Monosporascus sp. CRB-9-2]